MEQKTQCWLACQSIFIVASSVFTQQHHVPEKPHQRFDRAGAIQHDPFAFWQTRVVNEKFSSC